MNATATSSPGSGRRRSHQVALVLLGTAGVIGLATVYDAWRQDAAAEDAASSAPTPVPVSADRVYANNDYIPGVGYYHAPYHAWFPHPFNYHDPARGYFAGGLWQVAPWVLALSQSRPSDAAVATALNAQRQPQQTTPVSRGFGFVGGGSAGRSSVRPAAPTPSAPRPGVIRGGFGFSAHPAGG